MNTPAPKPQERSLKKESSLDGIVERQYRGMTILSLEGVKPRRRVFYLNSYGMAKAWRLIKAGEYPGQHLWGCLELVRMGYEVAMPEEADTKARFFNYRRQDLKHLAFIRSWLGRDGIVYSAHTVVFWSPLLVCLKLLGCKVVTLFYAGDENLRFAKGYSGIIAMTPAAKTRAEQVAPHAKVAHLGWGVDLPFFPELDYAPRWFLSCGKSRRDFETLAAAASDCPSPIRLINSEFPPGITWPDTVQLFTGKSGKDWQTVSFEELFLEHYAGCAASLILLQPDPEERFASGFTQLLEALALARPVIVTRTGAVAGEIDVEKEGCGLFVPPNDSAALVKAMKTIIENPSRAEEMGRAGRRLCEKRYNIIRYAEGLHNFFETL